MALAARHRLARLLAGDVAPRRDSAMVTLPAEALELRVDEIGEVTMPIRAAQAKKLIAVARPAAFGRGEETLIDTGVRSSSTGCSAPSAPATRAPS